MPRLVAGPPSHAAPSTYKLAPSEAFIPESVTATFDGTGAGGSFFPTLSVYSQDGKLLARCPATSIAAGDSAEVTFAPLLRAAQAAAAASAGLSVASIDRQSVNVAAGAAFQPVDTPDFWTNDSTTYSHDSTGSAGHSGGILINTQGVYLAWAWAQAKVPGGGGAEPNTSWISVRAFSYAYPASQFFWQPSDAGSQAKFGQRFFPGVQYWSMSDTDMSYYPAADVTVPTQEYHCEVLNAGTQTMNFRTGLTVIRWADASGGYPP
jgi:hypothetical protein